MRGHRQSILGTGVRHASAVAIARRSQIEPKPQWKPVRVTAHRSELVPQRPEWRQGPGDPNIKRKWLMHIEDERAGEWKL